MLINLLPKTCLKGVIQQGFWEMQCSWHLFIMCALCPYFTDSTMDLVLNVADYYVLTPYVFPASWPEDGALRQIISLLVLTNLGAAVLYLGLGAVSYFFIFDHNLMKHPQFLEVWSLYLIVCIVINCVLSMLNTKQSS